jgi:uncharacterized protein YjbI with pentapeptide repeats
MSNLSIKGANISNGNFYQSKFNDCDLSNVIAKNCDFRNA